MLNTIEISHQAIRLIQCNKDSIDDIDVYPIKEGTDPISALGSMALPSPLGLVRVIIHHKDMLIGSMAQAPCPPERLQRLIEFEMKENLDGNINDSLISWYVSPTGGGGDMRILTMVTRKSLITSIEEALKVHKGKLVNLLHPAVALFHSWQQLHKSDNVILVDCGGTHTHVAIVENGALLFVRSCTFGMNELAQDISELRKIEIDAAKDIIAKLSKGTPDDIKQIIFRHAAALANNITNVVRFTQAQMKVADIQSDYIVFSGAGARVPFIIKPAAKHLNMNTSILNPFSGLVANLPPSQMDTLAELPSPWSPAFGACVTNAADLILDGKHQIHRENKVYRETSGILRVAAVFSLILVVGAFINQNIVSSSNMGTLHELVNPQSGLITDASKKNDRLQSHIQEHAISLRQAQFLDREHRAGRISRELLASIAQVQNAKTCPISLQSLSVSSSESRSVIVELHGRAQSTGVINTEEGISNFEAGLKQEFPFFSTMENIAPDTQNTPPGYHAFAYRLVFPEHMDTTPANAP